MQPTIRSVTLGIAVRRVIDRGRTMPSFTMGDRP
jgi:hypothetical protein